MPTLRYILVSAICIVLFLGQGSGANVVQAFPTLVNDVAVEDGAKVTVRFEITPSDNPTMTYSETARFVQGQHIIPPALEERMAGMHPGEVKTFPLSAEEGFGPYDETKIRTIPPSDLPLEAREGDTVDAGTGNTARIIRILPEKAVLDLNHPLAGKPLMVTLQIVTIENSDEGTTMP
jgi:FKBP-type peptidyl-prolyl cis-trans isomerase 2